MRKISNSQLAAPWLPMAIVTAFTLLAALSGCSSTHSTDIAFVRSVAMGDLVTARKRAAKKQSTNRKNRNYMLGRLRSAQIDLADGQLASSRELFDEIYDVLRTQGINDDNTVAAIVISEDIRFWKGEPFEQAMAFTYVAIRDMINGDFGNARAAAEDSLFLLKDFGDNEKGDREGKRKNSVEIAGDAPPDNPKTKKENETKQFFDNGYVAVETDFALGYILAGIASQEMGRTAEASDYYRKAVKYNPALKSLVDELSRGDHNMLLIADYGVGPVKMRYGPYRAYSRFLRWVEMPSDTRELEVYVDGQLVDSVPAVVDLNQLARDHKWNNMEDVRVAKGVVGDLLIMAGAGVAASGARNDNTGTMVAGIGMMIAGAIARENAKADVRFNEVTPQRVYVVPLRVETGQSVELRIPGLTPEEYIAFASDESSNLKFSKLNPAIEGLPESNLILPCAPSPQGDIRVVYARIPFGSSELGIGDAQYVLYANDLCGGSAPGDELPYILGGRCVKIPTQELLLHYQSHDNLTDFTLSDLESLYREEGIAISDEEAIVLAEQFGNDAYRHILDGGRSLVPPAWGSIGYLRIFCAEHDPYRPRTELVQQLVKAYSLGEALFHAGRIVPDPIVLPIRITSK